MKNEYDVEFENLGNAGNGGGIRWISMLVIGMVIFGFFSLIFYAYNNVGEPQQSEMITTISPEYESYKTRPQEAGGMPIENKDIEAYQLMRRAPDVSQEVEKVEKLLPLGERPIVRDIQNEQLMNGELQKAQNAENNADIITNNQPNSDYSQQTQEFKLNNIPQAVVADEVLENTTNNNVDDAINDVLSKQAAQIQAPQAAAQMQQIAPAQTARIATPVAPIITQKPVETVEAPVETPTVTTTVKTPAIEPKTIVVAPQAPKPALASRAVEAPVAAVKASAPIVKTAPIVKAPAAIVNSNVANGGTYIQFAAMRSATDAPRVWAELKAKNPELAPYSYYTEAVTIPSGATLHRLRARGFAGRAQALSICSTLKNRGQDCLVSAN